MSASAAPLRVLHVAACPFPVPQGSQVYIAGMTRALARRGLQVGLAAYGFPEGDWPAGVIPLPSLAPARLRVTRSGPHLGKPALDLLLAGRVARALRSGAWDLVHAHNVEAPFVVRLAQRLAGRQLPMVYGLHTSLAEELPVYGSPAWASGLGRIGTGVDRWIARDADASVAISARAEDVLRAAGARRVLRVPPGVDPAELAGGDAARARVRFGLGQERVVVYTGNADPYQDLDVLCAAMREVPEARLLVVGPSPVLQVLRVADEVGLPRDRLTVVASGALADALDALAVAALAVVPRAVCAGFPIKLLNMLGAGRATVVAAGSAPPIEGVIRVPDRDPKAMAGAISAALAQPEMTERLGAAAARAIRAGWTWEARAAALEGLYRELVSDGPRRWRVSVS